MSRTAGHLPAILLLATARDPDAVAVAGHLPAARTVWIDENWLRRREDFRWRIGRPGVDGRRVSGQPVDPQDVGAVFLRDGAPAEPGPAAARPGQDEVPHDAWAALVGALLSGPARWVNTPAADLTAAHTLHQLAVASEVGLEVPETLITARTSELIAFWHGHDGKVTARATRYGAARHTPQPAVMPLVGAEDLAALDGAPRMTMLQEQVPGARGLRVVLVGDEVFAARAGGQHGAPSSEQAPLRPHRLADDLTDRLRDLRRRLGLVYATAALRVTPEGRVVFLGIDPRGSFAALEEQAGLPVASAVAALLVEYASA